MDTGLGSTKSIRKSCYWDAQFAFARCTYMSITGPMQVTFVQRSTDPFVLPM